MASKRKKPKQSAIKGSRKKSLHKLVDNARSEQLSRWYKKVLLGQLRSVTTQSFNVQGFIRNFVHTMTPLLPVTSTGNLDETSKGLAGGLQGAIMGVIHTHVLQLFSKAGGASNEELQAILHLHVETLNDAELRETFNHWTAKARSPPRRVD